VALRTGAVDLPGGHKDHGRPVALLGGPAVLLTVMCVLAVVRPSELPWLLAPVALAVLGLADDLGNVRAAVRLVAEVAVCLLLLWATGTRLWAPPFVPGWLATALTALWLVGVVNAANCFDCVDGSLAGVGVLTALGVAGVASLVGEGGWLPAVVLAGALAGFWLHNRPPACIFLGDAGSLPVGLLLGWLAVRAASEQPASYTLSAVLLVSVPVFDFVAVHLRRWRRAGWRRLMESVGRDHLPHRVLWWAGSPSRGVAAVYLLQLGATLGALVAASFRSPWPGLAVLFAWGAVLLWVDDRLPHPSAATTGATTPAAVRVRPERAG
ncbi:MAG: undecaprenyl/decaprenyl-phosphate alpha-N-acetylglucosaminyl 1-phosphate transferase, partial [Firmicutes bacterium]|nr:undecaprenyl/decaprenyl-phosphate alpha-N-acetylglucosaminyl 1-phosphate transferase [Bacillota bacterium]